MADLTPESNVESVASHLVHHAIVIDNESPGDGLTMLLARMASLAKDLGCIARGTTSDWDGVVSHLDEAGQEKLSGVYGQQVRLIAECWSKKWLLCKLSKYLHEELERTCLEHHAALRIAQIDYSDDGAIRGWTMRPKEVTT